MKQFTAHREHLAFIDLQFARLRSAARFFVLEDFDVISDLRHLACFLFISMMASACQPPGDSTEPPTEPVADADGSENDDQTPPPEQVELALNDVSILLPPPTSDDPGLTITDLAFNGTSVWPDDVFTQFIALANGNAGNVDGGDVANNSRGSSIDISAFDNKAAWHVASIRVDPGAPGLSDDIKGQFGQQAQIRLVLQPITAGDVVHDVAAHMIYSFIDLSNTQAPLPGCIIPRFAPDLDRFRLAVDDLVALKSALAAGEIGDQAIETSGPLGVHPAAKASATTRAAFRDALRDFLQSHLDPSTLGSMAIMGLPGGGTPEPWIFLAMNRDRETGRFGPVPSPAIAQGRPRFAQMLDARPGVGSNPSVSPTVRANNLTPITCRFELPGIEPVDNPRGVSTAELFPDGDADRMREIVAVIADPTQAHFFNTDCVSCHTETRREMDILGTNEVAAPVDPDVLPTELWNVRNFGWFPSFLDRGVLKATATRRTATETEEVVEAVNRMLEER